MTQEEKREKRQNLKLEARDLFEELREYRWTYTEEAEKAAKKLKRKIAKLSREIRTLSPSPESNNVYQYEDFKDSVYNIYTKDDSKPQEKFFKNARLSDTDKSRLKDVVGYNQDIYHHLNKIDKPITVYSTELETKKEESKSNNIYDVMAAPSETKYHTRIIIGYDDRSFTVEHTYWKDTTLDRSDIYSFMRF